MKREYRGIRPDDLHGRMGLRNPERGFRTEMYFSTIPGEIAGMCSCHSKQYKLDGRAEAPVYQNETVPGVPHLIRGNRLDAVEFSHRQWQDELDFFAYDGVTIMQSYCFLNKYDDGRDIPQAKLEDIEQFLAKVRETGVKVLLRFAYELSPTLTGPTAETTLKHVSQLMPLVQRNKDVLYVLQCGFVGKFGEWHNSCHYLQDDIPFRRELMSVVLEGLPKERRTMMRYPKLKMDLYGTEPLKAEKAFTDAPEARIGHFNDGFMANMPYHGGTFGRMGDVMSIEQEMAYLDQESKYLPMDGELFWKDVGGAVLPHNAVRDLCRWHYDTFGMVHSNGLFEGKSGYSMDVWGRVPIDPMAIRANGWPMEVDYFTDAASNHVWRSYYEYIRDHLGYRIVLESADVTIVGRRVKAEIELRNHGFSSPVNPRPVLLVMKSGLNRLELEFPTSIQRWEGNGVKQRLSLEVEMPTNAPTGEYDIGFSLPDMYLKDRDEYAIRCANPLRFSDCTNWLDIKSTFNN